jgi:hypothetical protein
LAVLVALTGAADRRLPRRDGRVSAGCVWDRDTALLPIDGSPAIAGPRRSAARFLRETIGHPSVPALVEFGTGDADRRSAPRWAAIVPSGAEWRPGLVDAGVAVERVDGPAFAFGVQPAGDLPGIRFPAPGDLHRSRLGFAWPEGLDAEDFTLTAWVRPAEFRLGEHMIIASRSDAPFYQPNSRQQGWHLYLSDGGILPAFAYAQAGDGRALVSITSQTSSAAGQWIHLALSISKAPAAIALYVNGALEGRQPRPGGAGDAWPLAIGTFAGSAGTHPLRGDLVWTTLTSPALSDAAIAAMARDRDVLACGGDS